MPRRKKAAAARARSTATHRRYRMCPSCGHFCLLNEPQEYCMLCGTAMISECPECNEPVIYPTARYCPACGARLVGAASSSGGPSSPGPGKKEHLTTDSD